MKPLVIAAVMGTLMGTLMTSAPSAKAEAVRVNKAAPAPAVIEVNGEHELNSRIILRYTQLWNMYRVRILNSEVRTPEQQAAKDAEMSKVDQLVPAVALKSIHADLPTAEVRAAIKANSAELKRRLTLDRSESAKKQLAYLNKMIAGIDNPKLYDVSKKQFKAEFSKLEGFREADSTVDSSEITNAPASAGVAR